MFYSALTNGFYDSQIHGQNMPEDAIEISDELYKKVLEEELQGKKIIPDENGSPIAVERFFTDEELSAEARIKRNQLLFDSDHTQLPDSPYNFEEWAIYRQALRDVPQQSSFPHDIKWPQKPNKQRYFMAILSHSNGIEGATLTVTTNPAQNLDKLKAMQVPLPFATFIF